MVYFNISRRAKYSLGKIGRKKWGLEQLDIKFNLRKHHPKKEERAEITKFNLVSDTA